MTLSEIPIDVEYTNWRGETSIRTIVPKALRWSEGNEWHPQPHWEIEAFDYDRKAIRFFALADCNFALDKVN